MRKIIYSLTTQAHTMTKLAAGTNLRFSILEALVARLNNTLRANELTKLTNEELTPLEADDRLDTLDGQTPEEYFDDELNSVELYELVEHGDEFHIGSTFSALINPDGDTAASFVLTGFANEGVFSCCFASENEHILLT
jgi:hypothetical protein